MKLRRSSYHHGDLRAALLAEALRLLASGDADALSLRAVARGVGVSATAVYRHFPDKAALEHALACAGGDALADAQAAAMAAAGGGAAGFDATGRAYVRFALANPALFRLMIGQTRGVVADPATHVSGGLRMLFANTAALALPGADADARYVLAVQCWAIVHGLAMLMLDGQIAPDDALIDRAITASQLGIKVAPARGD